MIILPKSSFYKSKPIGKGLLVNLVSLKNSAIQWTENQYWKNDTMLYYHSSAVWVVYLRISRNYH